MSDTQKTSSILPSVVLAAALGCVLVGERVLGEGVARNFSTGLGALLCVAALVFRVRGLAGATGDVRAVEQRLLAGHLGVLAALGLYALGSDASLARLHLAEEPRTRVIGVLSVLWPALLLCSSAVVFFMELAYARMPIAASVELRRVRTAAYAGLTLAFSTVFLLSMNYVATARDVRRDVTYFKTTQPSRSTQRMLDKLAAPVKVLLFWRRTDDVLQQVEPYFATLRRHSPKLRYEVVDFALAPELAHKHRVAGNGTVLLVSGEGDKQKSQSFRIGNELTEARPQLKKLDSIFQQAFGKLTRPERSVQLTVGHGERNAKQADDARGEGTKLMSEIFHRLNLQSAELGMGQGLGSAVPDGASAVIVAGPRQKLMPEEAQTLLQYVRKGGRLLLMVDPDTDDGLAPLLEGLGVVRRPGTLVSDKNHMEHAHDESDKTLVFANDYSSHPTVTTVSHYQSEVASIFVRGVALAKSNVEASAAKPNVAFPLRSASDFFRDLDGDLHRDPDEPQETLDLMAAVTVSEKPGAPEGRAVIIGDGDFMTDKVASNNGNVLLFVDSLAWLIGNEELPSEVSSEEDIPIEHTRDKDKLWFYATTFGVPMPVAGIGLWVARRRRKRSEAGA